MRDKPTAAQRKEAAIILNKFRSLALSQEERSAIASNAAKAGMSALTPEQRSERARKAIAARWAKAAKKKTKGSK